MSTAAEAEAAWLVLRRLQGSNGVEMSTALARRARGGCDHAARGAAVASGELVGQGGSRVWQLRRVSRAVEPGGERGECERKAFSCY